MKTVIAPKNNLGNSKSSQQYIFLSKHNFQTMILPFNLGLEPPVLTNMFQQCT